MPAPCKHPNLNVVPCSHSFCVLNDQRGFSLSQCLLPAFIPAGSYGMRFWHSHTATKTVKDVFHSQLKASSLKEFFNEIAAYSTSPRPQTVDV